MAARGEKIASLFVALGADISEFERKMDRVVSKTRATAQGISDAGRGLTKAITLPLVAIAGLSAKAAVDFETAFAGVRKTVDATEEEFARFRRGILDMNAELPASAKEIAAVAEQAGQLGVANSALLSFTRVMIDLGETTNITANDAATALARMANVMGTSQSDFDRLGSSIVALGNNLETTEAEIVEMAQRIAGAGRTINLSEGEVLGFAAALSSVGIRADAGGTAISKVFIEIAKAVDSGGDKLRKFAQLAGQSADEFSAAFKKDAAEATVRFIEGLGRVEEAGGSLFGVLEDLEIQERRMVDALLRTANAGDKVRESLALGNTAFEENTALVEEAGKRYETTESKIRMAVGQAQNAAIAIGDNMLGAIKATLVPLKSFFEFVESTAIAFGKLPLPIRAVSGALLVLVASVGPALVVLGSLARAMVAVQLAAQLMSAGIKRALISTGVGIALVALGTAASMIITEWEKVGPFFEKFWNDFVLLAATKVDTFLRILQRMTVWQPAFNVAIGAARKSLAGIIDEATIERGRLIYEENMRRVQKAIKDAGEAADQAKLDELMAELEDMDFDLSGFGAEGGDVDAVAEAFTALGLAMQNITSRSVVFGREVNLTREKIGAFEEAVVALLDAGLKPADERIVELLVKIAKLKEELASLPEGAPDTRTDPEMEPVNLEALFSGMEELETKFVYFLDMTEARAASWAQSIAATVKAGIDGAAHAFLEGIGKMAVGEASLGNVMSSVLSVLADMAIRVGKITIGFGVSVEAIKKALLGFTGIGAIAAGAALIALGSAVKAKLAASASGGGGGGGSYAGAVNTSLGGFQPTLPRERQFADRSGSTRTGGSPTFDMPSERRKQVVQVVPRATPSGDLVWGVEEGSRRIDRRGTDDI